MGTIVAIGGDQNNRNGHKYETEMIDKKIVGLTKKENPNFLFIGIANEQYELDSFNILKTMYFSLGCKCHNLTYKESKNPSISKEKITSADIIYLGGGDTPTLIKRIKENNLETLLLESYKKGVIMCGSSAGAIAYFKEGLSDYNKKQTGEYALVSGLNYMNAILCPHYTIENRKESFKKSLKDSDLVGIALDNNAALIINDEYSELISCDNSANAYRCFYKDKEYYKEVIVKNYSYKTKDLVSKKMLNY